MVNPERDRVGMRPDSSARSNDLRWLGLALCALSCVITIAIIWVVVAAL